MIKKYFKQKINLGFSILEVLLSVVIFSIILLAVISFLFWITYSNSKTNADRESLENARRVLDIITSEIKKAKGIYTPTTTATQLSLETPDCSTPNENYTFIDFFLCGSALCLKKEYQSPISLTPDSIQVTNLEFLQILTNNESSVQINLTVSYNNPGNDPKSNSSVILTSTASLRNY